MKLIIKAWLRLTCPIEEKLGATRWNRAYYLIHDFNNGLYRRLDRVKS